MIRIVPFRQEHLAFVIATPQTKPANLPYQEVSEAFTIIGPEGILCCVGRAYKCMVWCVMSVDAGRHMLALTRTVRWLLSLHDRESGGPLEALCVAGHENGFRWLRMFGFRPVGINNETGQVACVR